MTNNKRNMKHILIVSRDPWLDFRQMENISGITNDGHYRFFINDFDCQPDFVVIKEKALREPHLFDVPKQRTILLTGEPYSVLAYPKGFCSQFGTVCACQKEVKASKGTTILRTPAMLSWFVGAYMDNKGGRSFTMDYNTIKQTTPKKEKTISVISSTKAFSKGHVDRLRFIEKLKNHYGDRVDIFGHGFCDFADKWDVLAPYKYHIVIENSVSDYYWTEKISDCYLSNTYPLYHGCTNIHDYFPDNAFTRININDFENTVNIIDQTIAADIYSQRQQELAQSKALVLDNYNIFNMIADVCRHIEDNESDTEGHTIIRPASKFFSWHNMFLYTIGRNYYKLTNKLR